MKPGIYTDDVLNLYQVWATNSYGGWHILKYDKRSKVFRREYYPTAFLKALTYLGKI